MVSATVHSSVVYGFLAFVYGFTVYVSKHAKGQISGEGGPGFQPRKLVRTVVVGVVVGVYAAMNGDVSAAGVNNVLPLAVPVADQVVKVLWTYFSLGSVLNGLGVGNNSGGQGN